MNSMLISVDTMISRFGRTPTCDRQMDGQTVTALAYDTVAWQKFKVSNISCFRDILLGGLLLLSAVFTACIFIGPIRLRVFSNGGGCGSSCSGDFRHVITVTCCSTACTLINQPFRVQRELKMRGKALRVARPGLAVSLLSE